MKLVHSVDEFEEMMQLAINEATIILWQWSRFIESL